MGTVVAYFERVAIRFRPLGLPLGIIAGLLLLVNVIWWRTLPDDIGWLLMLAMLWSAGIAGLVLWFHPKSEGASEARSYGRFMQLYITWFMTLWFPFLILVTLLLFIDWLKNAS